MRPKCLCTIALCLSALITACSTTEPEDGWVEWAVPVINTTDETPTPGTELNADGRGRLELSPEGCVYLVGSEGSKDLVWPADFTVVERKQGLIVTNSAGARLEIGRPVTLVGAVQPADSADVVCRVTEDASAIYVVDFMGKTLGGG